MVAALLVWAGMPGPELSEVGRLRLDSLSFFALVFLASAGLIALVWKVLRRDLPWLPRLGFWRALGLTFLWGLVFVLVLTMISGARELLTPGAWKKQGWTYMLADSKPTDRGVDLRRQALERLRFSLWQHAATHDGDFPPEDDAAAADQELWHVPGWPGLSYLYVADQSANQAGQLLVFEPALNDDERMVLLTNGVVGFMRTAEIEQLLPGVPDHERR